MRSIVKFRILPKTNNEFLYFDWKYGELTACNLQECRDETIGLFAGRKDKNEIDLYDGDIIKKKNGEIKIVSYSNYKWLLLHPYEYKTKFLYGSEETLAYYFASLNQLEIIGNVHINPELYINN